MSLTLKTEGDFEQLAKGQYEAVCFRIVDMGTTEQQYKDGPLTKKKRVHISFEVPGEKMSDGRPFSVSKTYTASLFESAALRKDLVSWRGRNFSEEEEAGFDISKLLGCTANVDVGHTENGNPKIIGIFKPDGGVKKVPTHNEPTSFDLDIYCDEFNGNSNEQSKAMCDIFDSLPIWQQEDIEKSFELIAAKEAGGEEPAPKESLADLATDAEVEKTSTFEDDEIPF
jgi:hypothetical protein|tara:strand:- start:3424 stop:4104 length:681 start_codon:yes stop_codon:yes gene_type:complete